MWELYHGMPAWHALDAFDRTSGSACSLQSLSQLWTFPRDAPPALQQQQPTAAAALALYADLAVQCLREDPLERPTFSQACADRTRIDR